MKVNDYTFYGDMIDNDRILVGRIVQSLRNIPGDDEIGIMVEIENGSYPLNIQIRMGDVSMLHAYTTGFFEVDAQDTFDARVNDLIWQKFLIMARREVDDGR